MQIGVFDSGLGGLITLRAVAKQLPEYDYVYLGDTKRVPYGDHSQNTIYSYLKEGIDFLVSKKCALIIVACNTASAEALGKLQRSYLPKKYPKIRVLGMIVPIVEECTRYKKIGLIGTQATIDSKAYPKEFKRQGSNTQVQMIATPLLVPIIENGEHALIKPLLEKYLTRFKNIDALILGCTHYPIIKKEIRSLLSKQIIIIAQDTIIPRKTKEYLQNHPEIERKLSQKSLRTFYATEITPTLRKHAVGWFGTDLQLKKATIEQRSKKSLKVRKKY